MTTADLLEHAIDETDADVSQEEIYELLAIAGAIGQNTAGDGGRLWSALEDVHNELDEHQAGLSMQHDAILHAMTRTLLDEYQLALGLVTPAQIYSSEEE